MFPKEKNPLAFFHEEPISDRDYTMAEAVAEAKRCLHCRVPQCRNGCPIENEIPQFIHEVALGNFGAAAEYIYHRSDFPALCGRICPRETQCEGSCVLGKKGKHIEIGKLERFVADLVLDNHILDDVPSKKCNGTVAIVGSGPAGLAAAQDLARMDYDVTIFESSTQPGGTLTYGIPTFRLHKEYVRREAERLEHLGVTIRYETKVGRDISLDELAARFDAVFIAVGTMEGWKLGVENDHLSGVIDAAQFLYQVEQVQLGEEPLSKLPVKPGDTVLVVGAGNVAIDAARTALRLKADVKIVYRRGEKNMKCLPSEYEEAKEEGIQFKFYSAPRAVTGTDHVEGLKIEKQKILEDGTMVPTGEFETVPADKIIAAIGNKPEMDIIQAFGAEATEDGYIESRNIPYGMTSRRGIFAAGDVVHKPKTVVLAMREGKRTAAGIDEYIRAKHMMEEVEKG